MSAVRAPEGEVAQGTLSKVPQLLDKRGWSAMDLARKANIAHGTALSLKKGETDGFSVATLQKVAEALGVHWLDLFREDKSG
jgi:transcriptional regulator with XRE-family HTH domain